MRIGLSVHFQYSFFSAGSPQTALALAETFRIGGHDVVFLNVGESSEWWDDCKQARGDFKVNTAAGAEPCDLVIEIGQTLLKPEQRARHGACVWLVRKAPLFTDTEFSLYPVTLGERNLEGVREVWLTDELCSSDDEQYIALLTRLPTRRVPSMWTPTALEAHRREIGAPVWQQVLEGVPGAREKPWSVHICETNTSSTASCTVPLLIMREVHISKTASLDPVVKIHNADHIKRSEFFRFNVLGHVFSDIPDMSGVFLGRQRVIDWSHEPKSIVIAHSRFLPFRPYLLDLLWVGVPFLHNSAWLRRLGGIAEAGYYPDNSISEARKAFERVSGLAVAKRGQEALNELMEMRRKLLETVSPMRHAAVDVFCLAAAAVATKPLPATVPAAPPPAAGTLRVGFCDFWVGFKSEYNPFTLILHGAGIRNIVGVDIGTLPAGAEGCDLVIFGSFGNRWKSVKEGTPLIHYTGECTPPIVDPRIKMNCGFEYIDMVGEQYLRLPLWMLEINWFGADPERLGNPKPISVEAATTVNLDEIGRHKKFCAFVVSNPCQPMRNQAFQWLSTYKKVDSAGHLFNNVGRDILAANGGGGGELQKFEFLKDYKFCLAYENKRSPGYVTEKLLHAKAAGCVPIYWGDPKIERDFDVEGFIDARNCTSAGELIALVKEVDENPGKWLRKVSVPAVDPVKRELVRRTLSEFARRAFKICGVAAEELEKIPRFLGATGDTSCAPEPALQSQLQPQPEPKNPVPPLTQSAPAPAAPPQQPNLFVTASNKKFLPALDLWLKSIDVQKVAMRVYLMADVSEESQAALKQTWPVVDFRALPTAAPEGFPDFWIPEHFAWKTWVYKDVVTDQSLQGQLVMYLDAGGMLCRMPVEYLEEVLKEGVVSLEDPREDNAHWCSRAFCEALAVSEQERAAKQVIAGAMAFVAGHPLAVRLFTEAAALAEKRQVIVGPKWAGTGADGRPFGHRHDQSIFSILVRRLGIPLFPLDRVYCDRSLRHTYITGASLYFHRGRFKVNDPIATGIDDAWVITLDRRADRLTSFKAAHPDLAGNVFKLPAFDGRSLVLTPRIARLFKPHDFNWKKPVMGCALSHLALWQQLAIEKPDVRSYLILEDDARLQPEWREAWEKAAPGLPADWDIVYLGGILPPNRKAFEAMACEPIGDHGLARVRANSVFGQQPPNRYFHFCAYSYVLSRRGAEKVLEVMRARGGYWTSADHMLCNLPDIMNIYFLNPLPGGCFQDSDPAYQNSVFNDFSRTDTFDSDLWNNTERFSESEVAAAGAGGGAADGHLDILGALEDARKSQVVAAAPQGVSLASPSAPQGVSLASPSAPQGVSLASPSAPAAPESPSNIVSSVLLPPTTKRRLVSVAGPRIDVSKLYELSWFRQIFWENAGISIEIERLPDGSPLPDDEPIVVFQRPFVGDATKVLEGWRAAGKRFYIFHISDEYGQDPIDCYSWPECLGVLRNYARPDFKESETHRWIPLGWHWAILNGEPYIHTPRPPFREYAWSFVGQSWAGRQEKLRPLEQIQAEHKVVWMDQWDSPRALGREQVLSILMNSWMVPCPAGQNYETFRIYEALEAGAVPVFVKEGLADSFFSYFGRWVPVLAADNWEQATAIIHTLRTKPDVYEQVRNGMLEGWEKMKAYVKTSVKTVYRV